MFRLELILRNSHSMLSVQRKLEEDADTLYEQILAAIDSNTIQMLKFSCDRHLQTKVAVLSSEIIAVNLTAS